MKTEIAAYTFLMMLGILVIGTLLNVDSALFDDVWYCVNWATMTFVGVYFITNTKNKYIKRMLIGIVSWIFSALSFRVIYILLGISTHSERPMNKHTVLWYILVFIFYITIATLNERFTNSRTSKSN